MSSTPNACNTDIGVTLTTGSTHCRVSLFNKSNCPYFVMPFPPFTTSGLIFLFSMFKIIILLTEIWLLECTILNFEFKKSQVFVSALQIIIFPGPF